MKKFFILGTVLVALTACTDVEVPFISSTKVESSNTSSTSIFITLKEQLNGKEFFIVTDGYNKKTSIGFTGDRVYGCSGINRYFGDFKVSGEKLVFGEFGLTRMGGSQKEMTQELQFLDLLKNNKSVKLSGGTLTLTSNEGIVLIFRDSKLGATETKK